MNKSKKIIVLLLIGIIGIVGLTIAYFTNSTNVENTFTTKEYGTEYIESFVSPNNWLPGDTTPKTVVATNTGEVDEAVRIKVEEKWTTHNSGNAEGLNGWIDSNGNKTSHTNPAQMGSDERAAILNLANTSDWVKDGDYYYYKYKIAPEESTTSFLESVTFNPKTKLDGSCTETVNNGTRTITCNSTGDDYDNAKYILTLTIETVQYNKYSIAWQTNVPIGGSKPKTAVEVLTLKNNDNESTYSNGNIHEMFPFYHPTSGQLTENTDYRYIGNDPYNYVYFNCSDMNNQSSSTCEVWRIIGVMNVDDGTGNIEQRLKLISPYTMPTNVAWASNFNNDWPYSSLKNELNTNYYNSLLSSAKSMIGTAKYYLSEVNSNVNYTADELYAQERKNTSVHSHSVSWNGIVGLMYLSDNYFTYGKGIDNNCYQHGGGPNVLCNNASNNSDATRGWIYNSNKKNSSSNIENTWTIASRGEDSRYAMLITTSGEYSNMGAGNAFSYRPVVYLTADVNIISGTGMSTDPYVLYK